MNERIKKSIEWFKELLGETTLNVSTRRGELLSLNSEDGLRFFDFRVLFHKKVLYYDNRSHTLCTYCPSNPTGFKNKWYKRIESNDYFQYILAYVADETYDILGTVPVYIKIDEYGEDSKWFPAINKKSIVKRFHDTVGDCTSYTAKELESLKSVFYQIVNHNLPEEAKITI